MRSLSDIFSREGDSQSIACWRHFIFELVGELAKKVNALAPDADPAPQIGRRDIERIEVSCIVFDEENE